MLPKWNLNSFAEHVVFILKEHGAEYAQSLQQVRRDRLDMAGQLASLPGLTVYPSQGNFLFVRLPVGAEGTVVRDRMLTEHRILVRECGNKIGSSSRFLRLVVRPQVDVRRLVSGLEQVLYGTRRGAAVPELATGTSYSSGTAAVDRLVGATNGAGMQGLAAQAMSAGGQGLSGAPSIGGGMPMPAVAGPASRGRPARTPGGGMPSAGGRRRGRRGERLGKGGWFGWFRGFGRCGCARGLLGGGSTVPFVRHIDHRSELRTDRRIEPLARQWSAQPQPPASVPVPAPAPASAPHTGVRGPA
ncbi:Histidinol-phosphate aminotransferase [Streptomyces alboniger]